MSILKRGRKMKISIKQLGNKALNEQRELDEAWATTIKARDNWRCAICGNDYAPNAHHIVPRENKQFRYELDNGISLCLVHHKFNRVISAHNNPFAFFLWLQRFNPIFFSAAVGRNREMLRQAGISV